jgi:hypothetical protein
MQPDNQQWRRQLAERAEQAREYALRGRAAAAEAWGRVGAEERARLRTHATAIAVIAVVTLLTLALGLAPAGPLIFADLVIAVAAWVGGVPAGFGAALGSVLVLRLAGPALGVAEYGWWTVAVLLVKGAIVAVACAEMAARARADRDRIAELEQWIQQMQSDARKRNNELKDLEATSAETHATLRDEADEARRQLATLQSVTDPSLNVLHGRELVTHLLDRLRVAVGADGVAVCHFGLRARIFAGSAGVQPVSDISTNAHPDASEYQAGKTTLIHNDAARVGDTSFCPWPDAVTSLIAVPVVHAGQLRVVLEVANYRARRSTEWELALIQVVAERAAGLLGQDAVFNRGAVA